jgi:pimeloyl-ACP methyl ester carboxylesterase
MTDRDSEGAAIQIRSYGTAGPLVVVLHGGPGAAGYMAPVARGLADSFRVLEPLQRGSGGEPLTVARHVADLDELVERRCGGLRPALVGHSWGAMLALAYAAAHPHRAGPIVLIGCGTFDGVARDHLRARREERMDDDLRRRMARLQEDHPDPDERLRVMGSLMLPLDSYELASTDQEMVVCDARAHHETWEDMLRLQEEGVYPAAFVAIEAPVLMLHGAVDPHPGRMIRVSLAPYLPQLEYLEWERCGHYPWLERAVRDEFFAILRTWLAPELCGGSAAADA